MLLGFYGMNIILLLGKGILQQSAIYIDEQPIKIIYR